MSFGYPPSTGLAVQRLEAIFLCWDIHLAGLHLLNLGPVTRSAYNLQVFREGLSDMSLSQSFSEVDPN